MDKQPETQELNWIVNEYLMHCGLHKTAAIFNEELRERSTPLPKEKVENPNSKAFEKRLLQCFDNGNYSEFFNLWHDNFSKIEDDINVIQLKFSLHAYFVLFPIKKDKDCYKEMEGFKNFLSCNGHFLSHSQDFALLCALPYMENLKQQASYKYLFDDKWTKDLRGRLQEFLCKHSHHTAAQPKLLEFYNLYLNKSDDNYIDSSSQISFIMRDYQVLIQTVADLIELLESTAQGIPVTQEQIKQVIKSLFSEQELMSTDLTRPGTAAQTLRESISIPLQRNVDSNLEMNNKVKILRRQMLDYDKIKHDLGVGDDKTKYLLFQALRSKLTESPQEERIKILDEYLSHDILECVKSQNKSLTRMLNGKDELLKRSFIQLITAIASFYEGRNYIAKKESMIEILIKSIQCDNIDPSTKEDLLQCLNKLNLRRNIQMLMIERNLIAWLVNELEASYESPHFNEWGIELLTNLCLRSAGKSKCVPIAAQILNLLSGMLQSNYPIDIKYCLIGTLYSITAIKSIKEEALKMGILEVLNESPNYLGETMNKHIQFVIERLISSEEDDIGSGNEDDNDDDSNDLEEPMKFDNDDALCPYPGELLGEDLLNTHYSVQDSTGRMSLYNNSQMTSFAGVGSNSSCLKTRKMKNTPKLPSNSKAMESQDRWGDA